VIEPFLAWCVNTLIACKKNIALEKGWFMVLNATFNNISAITWRSVLLVEKTEVLGENHRSATSH
jgi:hypothetical protein